jgi:hypothetical protein
MYETIQNRGHWHDVKRLETVGRWRALLEGHSSQSSAGHPYNSTSHKLNELPSHDDFFENPFKEGRQRAKRESESALA